jgi:hypothetical protein
MPMLPAVKAGIRLILSGKKTWMPGIKPGMTTEERL